MATTSPRARARAAPARRSEDAWQAPATGGWPCVYPEKVRKTLTFLLTEEGTTILQRNQTRMRMSRSDFLEHLLRKFADKVPELFARE